MRRCPVQWPWFLPPGRVTQQFSSAVGRGSVRPGRKLSLQHQRGRALPWEFPLWLSRNEPRTGIREDAEWVEVPAWLRAVV